VACPTLYHICRAEFVSDSGRRDGVCAYTLILRNPIYLIHGLPILFIGSTSDSYIPGGRIPMKMGNGGYQSQDCCTREAAVSLWNEDASFEHD
jgi:hypothetical protein